MPQALATRPCGISRRSPAASGPATPAMCTLLVQARSTRGMCPPPAAKCSGTAGGLPRLRHGNLGPHVDLATCNATISRRGRHDARPLHLSITGVKKCAAGLRDSGHVVMALATRHPAPSHLRAKSRGRLKDMRVDAGAGLATSHAQGGQELIKCGDAGLRAGAPPVGAHRGRLDAQRLRRLTRGQPKRAGSHSVRLVVGESPGRQTCPRLFGQCCRQCRLQLGGPCGSGDSRFRQVGTALRQTRLIARHLRPTPRVTHTARRLRETRGAHAARGACSTRMACRPCGTLVAREPCDSRNAVTANGTCKLRTARCARAVHSIRRVHGAGAANGTCKNRARGICSARKTRSTRVALEAQGGSIARKSHSARTVHRARSAHAARGIHGVHCTRRARYARYACRRAAPHAPQAHRHHDEGGQGRQVNNQRSHGHGKIDTKSRWIQAPRQTKYQLASAEGRQRRQHGALRTTRGPPAGGMTCQDNSHDAHEQHQDQRHRKQGRHGLHPPRLRIWHVHDVAQRQWECGMRQDQGPCKRPSQPDDQRKDRDHAHGWEPHQAMAPPNARPPSREFIRDRHGRAAHLNRLRCTDTTRRRQTSPPTDSAGQRTDAHKHRAIFVNPSPHASQRIEQGREGMGHGRLATRGCRPKHQDPHDVGRDSREVGDVRGNDRKRHEARDPDGDARRFDPGQPFLKRREGRDPQADQHAKTRVAVLRLERHGLRRPQKRAFAENHGEQLRPRRAGDIGHPHDQGKPDAPERLDAAAPQHSRPSSNPGSHRHRAPPCHVAPPRHPQRARREPAISGGIPSYASPP